MKAGVLQEIEIRFSQDCGSRDSSDGTSQG
jgi:hypothetical protein